MGCGASKSSVVDSNAGRQRDNSEIKPPQLEDVSAAEERSEDSNPVKEQEVVRDDKQTEVVQISDRDQPISPETVENVASSQDKFAAFDVPLSREARPPPNRFSDKNERLSETELADKLKEKQRAAAARKEEELKKKAHVTSRISMKDRLRKEIMESRKQEEEAALLEPETAEEDDTLPIDEIEGDIHFNETPHIEEF